MEQINTSAFFQISRVKLVVHHLAHSRKYHDKKETLYGEVKEGIMDDIRSMSLDTC